MGVRQGFNEDGMWMKLRLHEDVTIKERVHYKEMNVTKV